MPTNDLKGYNGISNFQVKQRCDCEVLRLEGRVIRSAPAVPLLCLCIAWRCLKTSLEGPQVGSLHCKA